MPRTASSGTPRAAAPAARRTTGVASVAALLPLAIGLGSMATVPKPGGEPEEIVQPSPTSAENAGPAVCGEVENSNDCHSRFPTGCNTSGKYDAALSFLKDLTEFPAQAQATLGISDFLSKEAAIPATLGKENHKDLAGQLASMGEGRVFATVGYLYAIKQEGKEVSNCGLDAPDAVDYHMYIGYDPKRAEAFATKKAKAGLADEGDAVIVEMTPHYRERFHPEWVFTTLEQQVGKQVKVTGQLLADNEHFVKGQDCALGKTATCFRATIWELHPVTGFAICEKGDCTATTGTWTEVTP
jgi:hypothetical protein